MAKAETMFTSRRAYGFKLQGLNFMHCTDLGKNNTREIVNFGMWFYFGCLQIKSQCIKMNNFYRGTLRGLRLL